MKEDYESLLEDKENQDTHINYLKSEYESAVKSEKLRNDLLQQSSSRKLTDKPKGLFGGKNINLDISL